jgi:hypothetical protein
MLRFHQVPIASRPRFGALRRLYIHYYAENTPDARGLRLLRTWLSPPQLEQFNAEAHFDVIGCDTERRYRIHYGTATNVYELDDEGRHKRGWCFVPQGRLVPGDVMLAQKIALETCESCALSVAMKFLPNERLRDDHLARRVLVGDLPGGASTSQPNRWSRFCSNANRGGGTMPTVLVIVIQLGLMLGAVEADCFKFRAVESTSETPAQQSAQASQKWCPPRSWGASDDGALVARLRGGESSSVARNCGTIDLTE